MLQIFKQVFDGIVQTASSINIAAGFTLLDFIVGGGLFMLGAFIFRHIFGVSGGDE